MSYDENPQGPMASSWLFENEDLLPRFAREKLADFRVKLDTAERERDEAREKLAACREAIKEYLKYHQHRMRREPGCRCGQCLEVDPNCPCHKLERALAATEGGD